MMESLPVNYRADGSKSTLANLIAGIESSALFYGRHDIADMKWPLGNAKWN